MHPHILIFMAFLSGIILTLYHGVRLIPIRMDPERPRRPFLSSLLLFCFIAILFFGFLYWTTLHTAVEVPLTLAAPDEQYLEGWLMLPPGSYWGALVIPQEAQPTSATAGHALAKDFYDLDYSVSINGKVADREIGTKSVNRGEQQF
ncbi:MAG: hypothetical protein HYV26_19355, partial [Candidatus Hydrogenedentes bacterium]|nr:hypothetical protein [Candidatus Hydrogenedentota bacterium]